MLRPLKPFQLIVDAVIAGIFAVVALASELWRFSGEPIDILASVLTCLLMALALAVRRVAPGLSLAIAWAGAITQMGFGRPPIIADLAIFAVLYATAAYGSRATFWTGFASSIVGALVITAYLFGLPDFADGRLLTLASLPLAVAVLVAAGFALLLSWTIGALVRTDLRARENRAAQVRAETEALAEQERVRIARDMHDVVAHSLAVVIAQADGARYAIASGAHSERADLGASERNVAIDALSTIGATARSALADVRLLLTQLRHRETEGPQPTLADLEALYAQVRASGVELRIDVDPAPPREPGAAVQLALYRILQEALTNALRHGDGGPVSVRLAWLPTVARGHPGVELEVRNRCLPGDRPTDSGHGLIGMGERASLVGGWLTAGDGDGEFIVAATLPTEVVA